MPIVIVDGIEDRDWPPASGSTAFRPPQRAGVEIPHYCWHPGLSVVASCRMCLVEIGHAQRRDRRRSRCCRKLVPGLPDAGHGRHGVRHQQREGAAEPGDGRGGPAARSSDRLPDLRQGGRVLLAGLSLRVRPGRAPGRHPAVHQPPPRDGRHGHAVRRSLRDVHPLRAVHARDQRHERAAGHQPRQPRRDRRLPGLSAATTSCRATWSISARSGRWATRTFSTSSASGS